MRNKSLKGQNSLNSSLNNNSVKRRPSQVNQKKESKGKQEKRKKPPKTMVDRISKSIVLQIANLSVDKAIEQIQAKKDEKKIRKQEIPKTIVLSKRIEANRKEEKEIKLMTENEDSESCSLSVVPNQE